MRDDVWFYAHKLAAARRAHAIMQHDFVILDSETTGLDSFGDRFVELAVVSKTGETLFNSRLNPGVEISTGAENVHHISQVDVAEQPYFAEIYPDVCRALGGKRWVIYNAEFDAVMLFNHIYRLHPRIVPDGVLYRSAKAIKQRLPAEVRPRYIHCAMWLYAQFYGQYHEYWGNFTWKKLTEAAENFDVHVEAPAHSALGDCLRTLGVLRNLSNWYQQQEYHDV